MESEARRRILGVCVVLLSAVTFTGTTVSAVVSYEGGGEPFSAITVRFLGATVVLYALTRMAGLGFAMTPRQRAIALGLGAVLALQSYLLYNAFAEIPVGLALIIFYVYPMTVAGAAIALGEDRMTRAVTVALVLAFAGLVLVFNVTGRGLNMTGAGLALGAALVWTVVTILAARLIRTDDPRPVTFHMQAVAAAIYVAFWLVDGDVRLPDTTRGWVGYGLLPVFYAIANVSFFAGVKLIGSIRASLVMNVEPVVTIAAGYLVLGQVLTDLQLVGAALVIAAVFAIRLERARPKAAG